MKNGLKIAGAFLVGAAAGVLFAPKSGKETREDIAKNANDIKDDLGEKITTAKDAVKNKLASVSSNGQA